MLSGKQPKNERNTSTQHVEILVCLFTKGWIQSQNIAPLSDLGYIYGAIQTT